MRGRRCVVFWLHRVMTMEVEESKSTIRETSAQPGAWKTASSYYYLSQVLSPKLEVFQSDPRKSRSSAACPRVQEKPSSRGCDSFPL